PRLRAGQVAKIRVKYAGDPRSVSYADEAPWLATANEVSAINEPHIAPLWFPANDHPRDRARVKVRVEVPRGLEGISNGVFVKKKRAGAYTRWTWRSTDPMAPYLAFLLVGDFRLQHGVTAGRPWTNAVSRQLSAEKQASGLTWLKKTPTVVSWLEGELGAYPFSVTGGAITSVPTGFALENQTRPVYPETMIGHDAIMVHELAHQWFGDAITVNTWREIWLNEGFATYNEARYWESQGRRTVDEWLTDTYASQPADSPLWDVPVSNPGPKGLFDEAVYVRGGMTLAALRRLIGDEPFAQLMRDWVSSRRGNTATTAQFMALAEQVSGQDLDAFFKDWLVDTDRPALP
ncbi:MAG: M1 family metallopeptidase, partial [Nocardioides sp.]